MSRKLYTTVEVAKAAGVPRATLQYWIKVGEISARSVEHVTGAPGNCFRYSIVVRPWSCRAWAVSLFRFAPQTLQMT